MLDDLNPEQRKAVESTEGPVLVLAGAGSGKTRVLTYKVAYLIEKGLAKPWEVLAVTFTNKAAGEMKERIEKLVSGDLAHMWVGTFHSLFARMMRRFGDRLGYSQNFAIYDREDQERLMKDILKGYQQSYSKTSHKTAVRIISSFKNKLQTPIPGSQKLEWGVDIAKLYDEYERRLKAGNALDFDDLLIKPLGLLREHKDVADIFQQRFRYILVDEFQDTNIVQNELIILLWEGHKNLTVVGDDDQAIYGWRGAELENILQFEHNYPGTLVVRLERNYRSTDSILRAAQAVIDHNYSRHAKTLWTEKKSDIKPKLSRVYNSRQESVGIAEIIGELIDKNIRPDEIAILYRINSQSRAIESVLREYNLPYTIVGGLKFYQRKEIKDLLAYLRILVNESDDISYARIINFPPRGIGDTTVGRISDFARTKIIDFHTALNHIDEIDSIKSAANKKIKTFITLVDDLKSAYQEKSFPDLVKYILEKTDITNYFLEDGSEEAFARLENLREFHVGVEEYVKANPDRRLEDFLQEVSLVSDIDEWEKGEMVSLMTIHSAKGLEFKAVFIAGLEEGIFPLIREGNVDIEEERRLFYVGTTRAKELLYLSCSNFRQGGMPSRPSRFLDEIPRDMLDCDDYGSYDLGFTQNLFREFSSVSKTESAPGLFPSTSDLTTKFNRGERVVHQKFGEGVISASEGVGDNEKVMVYFQGYGAKKLMVKFAGLERVDG